jgi:argininosuccinate lyase
MPQKRNPFLLEHILGRTALLTGAFTAAAGAMHGTPFTNSIATGTEGTRPLLPACQDATDVLRLLTLVVARAAPDRERMRECAVAGFTAATELANVLMREGPMDFRGAHKLTGELVLDCVERGYGIDSEQAEQFLAARGHTVDLGALSPDELAAKAEWGGGAGIRAVERCLDATHQEWVAQVRACRAQARFWNCARQELDRAVANCVKRGQA